MLWLTPALAATISVSNGTALQDAVDNASDGDTLVIATDYEPSEALVAWHDKDLVIEGDGAVADIPPLQVYDASLTLRRVRVRDSDSTTYPVQVVSTVAAESVLLDKVEITGNAKPVALFDNANKGLDVEVTASTFSGNTGEGALLIGYASTVLIDGSTFTGNQNDGDGGAIELRAAGDTDIRWTTFDDNQANQGGAIALTQGTGGEARIHGVEFNGDVAQDHGGDILSESYELKLRYILSLDPTAKFGGFVSASDLESLNVTDVLLHRPKAIESAGTIHATAVGEIAVARSLFCGSTNAGAGYPDAALIEVDQNTTVTLTFQNVAVQGSQPGTGSPGIVANDAEIWMVHTTWATNPVPYGLFLGTNLRGLHIENSIIDGVTTFVNYSQVDGTVIGTHNLWNDVTSAEVEPRDELALITSDGSSFYDTPPDFEDHNPDKCDSLPYLASTSPAVDAGTGLDPDGSPADIGAFGGESSEDLFDLPSDPGDEEPDSGADSGSSSGQDSGTIDSGTSSQDTGPSDTGVGVSAPDTWVSGGCRGPLGATLVLLGLGLVRRR